MNRRRFTQIFASLFAGAVVNPRGYLALGAQQPIRADYTHLWAKGIAKANTNITPSMLKSRLNLTDDAARRAVSQLVNSKIVAPTQAKGVYKTLNPLKPYHAPVTNPSYSPNREELRNTTKDVYDKLIGSEPENPDGQQHQTEGGI